MSELTLRESAVVGLCFEGLFYGEIRSSPIRTSAKAVQHYLGLGFYSALFVMYLRYQASIKTKGFLFYTHCALYVLCFATVVLDMTFVHGVRNNSFHNNGNLFYFISYTVPCHWEYSAPHLCDVRRDIRLLRLHLST